jgi:hypothetical protein
MAKVKINGKYVGGVWTYPFRLEVTEFLKTDTNTLEIEVVSTWINRMIGDARLPESERRVYSRVNPANPDAPLTSSGLLGPVKVVTY